MMQKITHDLAERIFGKTNGQSAVGVIRSSRRGRTVTEIVEQDPGQVSEVWCRKIFRQLLLSLERQYAMQLPHRIITPDTVIVCENGEPLLLSTQIDPRPEVVKDLTALAKVVHYAITRERTATRPLRSFALEGYSDSIITAVDRCMADVPAKRPHTINELRALLGIVALKQVPLARTTGPGIQVSGSQMQTPGSLRLPERERSVRRSLPRILAGMTAAIVLVSITTILGSLRGPASLNKIRNIKPQTADTTRTSNDARLSNTVPPAISDQTSTAAPHDNGPTSEPYAAYSDAGRLADRARGNTGFSSGLASGKQANTVIRKSPARPTKRLAAGAPLPSPARESADPSELAQRPPSPALKVAANNAILDLQIQPWGRVSVDGVDHGVSPPVKHLAVSPGRHSILVRNPNSDARVLEIDTTKGERRITVDFTEDPD